MAGFSPGVEAAGERANTLHTAAFEQEGHTGARRFVGSSAVEDDLAVARNLLVSIFELLESDDPGSRDATALRVERARPGPLPWVGSQSDSESISMRTRSL